ncbi:hypothetical protein EDD15DRAFT_2193413 [Pisolithus albus]|nr:hypothetical protein EDD15DRAFT_2193413 [Pisolithus albus]
MSNSSEGDASRTANGQKHVYPSALELGPRKKPTTQDPLVHRGRHFGRAVHAFCNVPTLLTNGIVLLSEGRGDALDSLTVEYALPFSFWTLIRTFPFSERKEFVAFQELLRAIQKGINGARADDTKGMKGAIIDWITPKGLDWTNTQTRTKLMNGEIQVLGDQWPVFLYADYTYDPEDPWNGLLRSGLLVSAYKHIFTSPSSVDQEPKATRSGNARIHGMRCVTKASIAYVAMQTRFSLTSAQVFSHTDLITDSERFYSSIMELLDDPDESDEVDQLITWWNRQIFPLYTASERLPSKNSALARIRQKRAEYKELREADNES